MDATKKLLVENSTMPMSVILVGVGKGDMTNMTVLDADGRSGLHYRGKRAERDIVQFVGKTK